MKKIIMSIFFLSLLAGCSGHKTSMQDVRAYCSSITADSYCTAQDSICAEYTQATLRSYNSAKECRQGCESVRQQSNLQEQLMSCGALFRAVEGKCNEFCNDNYE